MKLRFAGSVLSVAGDVPIIRCRRPRGSFVSHRSSTKLRASPVSRRTEFLYGRRLWSAFRPAGADASPKRKNEMEMTAQPDRRDAELRTPARQERSRPVSRAAEFATARSHSRRVRRLKFALPVAALLLAAGFVGYAYMSSPLSIAFDLSNVQVQDGKLVMTDPKLDGFTKYEPALHDARRTSPAEPRLDRYDRARGHEGQSAGRQQRALPTSMLRAASMTATRTRWTFQAASRSRPPTAWQPSCNRPFSSSARAHCSTDEPVEISAERVQYRRRFDVCP